MAAGVATYLGQVSVALCDKTQGQASILCVFQHTLSEDWRWAKEVKDVKTLTEVDFYIIWGFNEPLVFLLNVACAPFSDLLGIMVSLIYHSKSNHCCCKQVLNDFEGILV